MQTLTARDVDDLLAECIEELPAWVLERLGDTVIWCHKLSESAG